MGRVCGLTIDSIVVLVLYCLLPFGHLIDIVLLILDGL